MKKLIPFLLCMFLFTGVMAQETPQPAQTVLDEALALAAQENKNVCIIFHASWCGWCKRMDSIMNTPQNKPLFEGNWVTRHLTVMESKPELKKTENPGGMDMMTKYGGAKSGIPYFLIFNPKGQLLFDSNMPAKDRNGMNIRTNTGCPASPEEVEYFSYVLKHSTRLTDEQIKMVGESFLLKR
jgi:thioredoxin-related protein